MKESPGLSIVIPIWNEEKTLDKILGELLSQDWGDTIEIVLVDDGSKDKSPEISSKYARDYKNIKFFRNERNLGKSQTVKHGILNTKGDYVVIQDADLEYDVGELCQMFHLIKEKDIDVLYGNRFGKRNKIIYYHNYIGNYFLSIISNLFTYPRIRVYIPDMEVCYKMAKGDVFRKLGEKIVSTSNFGFEPEITAYFSKYKLNGQHLRFGIFPISYKPRTMSEGKKMKAFSDGIKALIEIFRFNRM